ncbi:MAG TPA: APC family permease [Phycisphaerae bacterium]|nr:APC family permease [Phycisphaerae bacterium]HRY67123.1 APC family permease [Phycisphaerae bacterium]HSA26508.1 APC family permease [Phycisphaerae bacterium]
MSMADSTHDPGLEAAGQLRADALGLLGTVSLTAAYMAPAASLIALFGPMVIKTGIGAGFVMLLGLAVTLPSAISFGMMAREMPSAGGVYAWASCVLGRTFGRWIGITTAIYYVLTVVFPPIVFGQLFNNLLDLADVPTGKGTWLLGAGLSMLIAGFATYRGVAVSSYLAFVLLIVQLVVMSALALTFAFVAGREQHLSWAPFLPPAGSWSGALLALPMAMLSLICDAATPVSEETRNAKRTIPLAIILTLLVVGIWNVLAFGALGMACPPDRLIDLCRNSVDNAVPPLAALVWGRFNVLVTVVGMIAMIGALVPCSTAASRLLFSLGRDGTLPRGLAVVHPRHRTPWNALHIVFLATALAIVPLALIRDPGEAIAWWSQVIAWFIIVVYFTANLCNFLFHLRFRPERFSILWNLVAPALAAIIQLAVLWQVVVLELWRAGWIGISAQFFIVVVSVLTAGWVYTLCAYRLPARSGASP